MNTLRDLILAVKQSDNENKQDYLDILTDTWNAFVTYFNTVVDMEKLSAATTTWTSVTEYLYKTKDEERRLNHNICVARCDNINHIAENIGFDLYIDINDRHQVACFIGDSLSMAYNNGIHRSMDEMVLTYSRKGEKLQPVNSIEEISR
jgi:hypothetical protein